MKPLHIPEANTRFGPPEGMAESQVGVIHAFVGQMKKGSCDGAKIAVVGWLPSDEERERIAQGGPIFLTVQGALPPHFLSTNFDDAVGDT